MVRRENLRNWEAHKVAFQFISFSACASWSLQTCLIPVWSTTMLNQSQDILIFKHNTSRIPFFKVTIPRITSAIAFPYVQVVSWHHSVHNDSPTSSTSSNVSLSSFSRSKLKMFGWQLPYLEPWSMASNSLLSITSSSPPSPVISFPATTTVTISPGMVTLTVLPRIQNSEKMRLKDDVKKARRSAN